MQQVIWAETETMTESKSADYFACRHVCCALDQGLMCLAVGVGDAHRAPREPDKEKKGSRLVLSAKLTC